jgi:hypothetical protein
MTPEAFLRECAQRFDPNLWVQSREPITAKGTYTIVGLYRLVTDQLDLYVSRTGFIPDPVRVARDALAVRVGASPARLARGQHEHGIGALQRWNNQPGRIPWEVTQLLLTTADALEAERATSGD